MSLIRKSISGRPRSKIGETMVIADHRRPGRHGARRHLDHARGDGGRHPVPKLCANDMVDAFGSCRLCLVEIEGRAGTPASCTTPVAAGHGGAAPRPSA